MQFDIGFNAIESERKRAAKELHDEVLPALARLARFVQSAEGGSEADLLCAEIHRTIESIRDLLAELHPVDLEELGLVSALSNICRRYLRTRGLSVSFEEPAHDLEISADRQLRIFRALQAVLRMFSNSGNDMMVLNCVENSAGYQLAIQCADRSVSASQWLSAEKQDFSAFVSYCNMADASFEMAAVPEDREFPLDLLISVPLDRDDCLVISECDVRPELKEMDYVRAFKPAPVQKNFSVFETNESQSDRFSLLENLAIEAERKRIREEINKLIVPRFLEVRQQAEKLRNKTLEAEISRRLSLAESSVQTIIDGLQPDILLVSGLVSSIAALVDEFAQESRIETTMILNPSARRFEISARAKFAIYRATQESLNNIEKHAQASRVVVKMIEFSDELLVSIEDNGRGIQPERRNDSRGLKIIRERLAEIGAVVSWEKSASFENGTAVKISVSLAQAKSAARYDEAATTL